MKRLAGSMKGKREEINPWKRKRSVRDNYKPSNDDQHSVSKEELELALKRPKFSQRPENRDLDVRTKRATLKVSPSVVALLSYSGVKELSQASGVIIEANDDSFIVLTSLNLIRTPISHDDADVDDEEDYNHAHKRIGSGSPLADNVKVVIEVDDTISYEGQVYGYDFYYNLLALKVNSKYKQVVADVKPFTTGLTLKCPEAGLVPFLRPHIQTMKLVPGDQVVAVGRYFCQPFEIMAASGCFSADRCNYDCKEFCLATCNITECGDGGPVVNTYGQVIGIGFKSYGLSTPFLPINVASRWWSHYKNSRESRHLSVGFEVTSLYLGDLPIIERVRRCFPDVTDAVFVEQVRPESSADVAGLKQDDIILECCGRSVDSFLELFAIMWEKFGEPVELLVARAGCESLLRLTMMVAEATPLPVTRWPCLEWLG